MNNFLWFLVISYVGFMVQIVAETVGAGGGTTPFNLLYTFDVPVYGGMVLFYQWLFRPSFSLPLKKEEPSSKKRLALQLITIGSLQTIYAIVRMVVVVGAGPGLELLVLHFSKTVGYFFMYFIGSAIVIQGSLEILSRLKPVL